MTSLQILEKTSVNPVLTPSPVRGHGDGMETEISPKSLEVVPVSHTKAHLSPRKKTVPTPSLSPGVLQLGKIHDDKAVEIEAVRIVVPKAAISHVIPAKNVKVIELTGRSKEVLSSKEGLSDPKKELVELKNAVGKLKNSEKKLLQDKEGLCNQLRVQTEVNRELKKLLVASMGDDLQYHFERMAREKNQLILENEALGRNMAQLSEQLERMSIQCDVWRSKFLASRVMADELKNVRMILQRQTRDAQSAIQDLMNEREQFRHEMINTQKLLEQLLVSLQWGRQQTYYPSGQPHSTTELAAANYKLAKAVNSHLLGNVGPSSPKKPVQPSEFFSTPAEKMAEMVLRTLDPVNCTEATTDLSFSESSQSCFLSANKHIGRFHPYTRYENITFNCCNHCQGDLLAL
ncbi:golgin-45-like [Microcaecilia unicolor]|uniref:Golgin-45-like n=1 Tax=Microcaecilia unicolor TaxID=1415580 RepID=A0A6P7XW97_9AMPH|nr:golgin-45-like [Microcaecilia unicolor]XP_030059705.1 golgin-45-like [Microcaecilia unicolor]XP_030059706.1 golgin-45-like [Microcaecilia unicolor]XP_030059707.1 golgin-45-like [Microcaecilia unicolor]XP_030059708.1 golgin-45-like [Microcaecilia unicolor]